jgi:hypothetical protein
VFYDSSFGWLLKDFDLPRLTAVTVCGANVTDFALSPTLRSVIWRCKEDKSFRLASLPCDDSRGLPIDSGELNMTDKVEYFFLDE